MKKNFRPMTMLFCGALVFAGLSFTSCSNDDDNNDNGEGGGNGTEEGTDPSTIASANLVAYFPFEDATVKVGEGITFSKKVGAASFVTGRRGNAYKGNTAEAYLEYNLAANNPFKSLTEYTVSMWVKSPADETEPAAIFQVNGGDATMGNLALFQNRQSTVDGQLNRDSLVFQNYIYKDGILWSGQEWSTISNPAFSNDKWFYFTLLYRQATSTIEVYANGKLVMENIRYSADKDPITEEQPLLGALNFKGDMTFLRFGAWQQQTNGQEQEWMHYYKGMLDEFRVYNKALSADEVKALYDAELTKIN